MAEKREDNKPKQEEHEEMEDDTSSDSDVDESLKTTVEEREYGTIPGSPEATTMALAHSRAQANPVVPRGPPKKKKKKKSKDEKPTEKKEDKK